MKGKSALFFFVILFFSVSGFSRETGGADLPGIESAEEADSPEVLSEAPVLLNESESVSGPANADFDPENSKIVVHRRNRRSGRRYALSFQILDPVLKSLVSVKEFDFSGTPEISRLIIPSLSFESQFEVHRYVTLGIKGSIIPELFSNPFYKGKRGGYFYTDSEATYPDASLSEEEWAHRVYSDEEKYFLNMHFLIDLTVRVLPFGEGLDTLKGFYIKAGGYFGFSIYQNVYLTYEESKSSTVGGEVSSASVPYFYPVAVSESGNGEELYEFVFGAVVGLGWQFAFPSGFFLDLGADLTYDNTRKLIPSVPGLGWNANCCVGYAW